MAKRQKKTGAPFGNQNARKHGFYSRYFRDLSRADLQYAIQMEGLDAEIVFLRLKLKELLALHPENSEIQLQAAHTLATLLRTQYQITEEQRKPLKDAITKVLTEVAVPLGIKIKENKL